ncbi:DUF898 family protein [Desulfobacterales bacterium HSG17]|nr:DUF898 family protein [Desulfobacterales bacterium HSG17]
MSWYYAHEDQQIGPITVQDMHSLLKQGTITPETLVWTSGMADWLPFKEVKAQFTELSNASIETSSPNEEQALPVQPDLQPLGQDSNLLKEASLGTEYPNRVNDIKNLQPENPIAIEFTGEGVEYFKIWIVNAVLSLLTLGLYSPWAKVRRKQYFYGNTRIKGASFEYSADPVKILKGRLVVVGVVIVLSGLIPFLGPIINLGFLIVFPWIIVRSMAFNAYYSSIRNIRFGFTATYVEALLVFVLLPLAAALTLGIMGPFAFYKQRQFVLENARYGQSAFTFSAVAGDYYKIFLRLLLPVFVGAAIIGAIGGIGFFADSTAIDGFGLWLPWTIPFMIILLYLYLFAAFTVQSSNLFFTSTKLGPHRFHANMEKRPYFFIVVTNTLATAVTLGLFFPFAIVRSVKYRINCLEMKPVGSLDQFVADEEQKLGALGEEMSDLLDFDIGL